MVTALQVRWFVSWEVVEDVDGKQYRMEADATVMAGNLAMAFQLGAYECMKSLVSTDTAVVNFSVVLYDEAI